jgi:hypothetical protein
MGAATIVIAAALRLWHLELVIFEGDESRLLRLAEDVVRLGLVPLNGPPLSAGIPSPPHFMYLLAPITAISRDPALAASSIALLNVAAVGGCLWLGWRAFGPAAGCGAAFLFAANPILAAYARRIWQPDILPAVAVLLFVALDLAIVDRRYVWAAAAFPIATLGVLVHPSFLPLGAVLIAPLVLLVRARQWAHLLGAVVVSAGLTIPSIIYEVETHWQDYPNVRYYASLHTFVDLDSARLALAVATGLGAGKDRAVPPASAFFPKPLLDAATLVQVVLLGFALLLALAAIFGVRLHEPRATRIRLAGLLAWIALPIVFSIRHWLPLQVHYLFPITPAPFLLIAYGARARTWLLVSGAVLAVGVVQAASVGVGLAHLAQLAGEPCFANPLWYEVASEREAVELAQRNGSTHAVVEIDGVDTPAVAYLMRADFPQIDLNIPAVAYLGVPIPPNGDLPGIGPIGFGQALAAHGDWDGPADASRILDATRRVELRYAAGMRVNEIAFSDRPRADQRMYVALASTFDDSADATQPIVWDIGLQDAEGRLLSHRPGLARVPAESRGQHLLSWFAFDPRQEIVPAEFPAGSYTVRLQLLSGSTPVAYTDPDGVSSTTLSLPVQIGPLARC